MKKPRSRAKLEFVNLRKERAEAFRKKVQKAKKSNPEAYASYMGITGPQKPKKRRK